MRGAASINDEGSSAHEHEFAAASRTSAATRPEARAPSPVVAASAPPTGPMLVTLQATAGNAAVLRLIDERRAGASAKSGGSLQRQQSVPDQPVSQPPDGSSAEPQVCEEKCYEFTWNGETYQIRESEWPAFQAEVTQALASIALPPLQAKLDDTRAAYETYQANELENKLGGVIVHEFWGAPHISDYVVLLGDADASVKIFADVVGSGNLPAACRALAQAETSLNAALSGLEDYLAQIQAEGASAITFFEITQTAAFAAFSVAAGAVLAPLALGTAATGGLAAGGTAFIQGVVNVAADETVGTGTNTAWENIRSVAIGTLINAAGGALGGFLADRIKGPVIAALKEHFDDLLAELSEEAAERVVNEALEAFAGGFSNMVQSVVADTGAVVVGQMTFDEFKSKVVRNLIANGIGGAIAGAKQGKSSQFGK